MQNTRRSAFQIWLLIIGYWLCAPAAHAGTFSAQWLFRDSISNVLAVKEVWLDPIAMYGVDGTTVLISADRITKRSDSSGSLIVSNLFNARSYRVTLSGPWIHTVFTNTFGTNIAQGALVNGADPAYLVAPLRDGTTYAYSQTAADLRYLRTNVDRYVTPGTNVVFRTNASGQLIISATAVSGSGGTTYTNDTGLPGKLNAGGTAIGTNDTNIAHLDAANIFSGSNNIANLGVPGILGAGAATTSTLDVTTNLHTIYTNLFGYLDANGFLTGVAEIGLSNVTETAAQVTVRTNVLMGIGTTAAAANLHVIGTSASSVFIDRYGGQPGFQLRRAQGTVGTPTTVPNGTLMTAISASGYDGTAFGIGAQFISIAAENWTTTNHGTSWKFNTTSTGSITASDRFWIDSQGNVSVGSSPPAATAGKFEVTGDIRATTTLSATNGYWFPSNALSVWPTAPRAPGHAALVNSNGTIYLLQSGLGATWLNTNFWSTSTAIGNAATNNGNNQFSTSQTINGTFLRVSNTSAANFYTDVGNDGAITNVTPNGGRGVWLTNAALAGTYTYMQSPSNGANVRVFGTFSNSVELVAISSFGDVAATSFTNAFGGKGLSGLGLSQDVLMSANGNQLAVKALGITMLNLSTTTTLSSFNNGNILFSSGTGNAIASSAFTATNGVILYQRQTIPTNSVPVSSASVTNWVLVNLTNTINSGGPMFIATNTAASGSFLMARPTLTVTTYP